MSAFRQPDLTFEFPQWVTSVHLIVIGFVDFNVRCAQIADLQPSPHTLVPARSCQQNARLSVNLNCVRAFNLPQQNPHYVSLRLTP
jgi:hypothetical protein